jgi:hypothetical protein
VETLKKNLGLEGNQCTFPAIRAAWELLNPNPNPTWEEDIGLKKKLERMLEIVKIIRKVRRQSLLVA